MIRKNANSASQIGAGASAAIASYAPALEAADGMGNAITPVFFAATIIGAAVFAVWCVVDARKNRLTTSRLIWRIPVGIGGTLLLFIAFFYLYFGLIR